MTLYPSASKTDLLLQCARPFEEGIDTHDEPGEAALYGSAYHELMFLAKNLKVDHLLPIAQRLERKWNCPGAADELVGHVRSSKKLLAKWLAGENPWGKNFSLQPAAGVLREQAFAINPSALTCRRIDLPSEEDHVYHGVNTQTEIPGTVDLLVLGDVPIVLDYKTGRDPFDFLTVPEDVTQLRTLGLAAWLETRRSERPLPAKFRQGLAEGPQEVILAVLHAPRGSVPAIYADLVAVADLQRHAEKLAEALRRKGDGSLRSGPCCRLCPARTDCVTQTGAYLQQAGALLEIGRPTGMQLAARVDDALATAEDVGKLHYFREQFRKLFESSGSLMKPWMKDHPEEVPIRPDGKILIIKTKSQENLSKASIIRALGKVAGEALITELRENGVIETSEREELWAVDDK